MTVTQQILLEEIVCGTCGITFAVPANWMRNRRAESGSIHCPNGCRRAWGESDADRLRKQLSIRDKELSEAKCEALRQIHLREEEQQNREIAEKKLRRVDKGVCPCCKRSFMNLARHMATKHPGKQCTE